MQIRLIRAGVAGWTFAAIATALPAQWTRLQPATNPPPAAPGDLMEYDLLRDRVVLQVRGETWEFDGSTWQKMQVTLGPDSVAGCMAYDSQRRRIVLFDEASDTWEWDGTQWSKAQPTVRPPGRTAASFAYDEVRQRCLLFGGVDNSTLLRDTWEWDGTTWLQRTPANPPAAAIGGGMAFDQARGRMVLYCGFFLLDHWEWDGSEWLKRNPATKPNPLGLQMPLVYDRCRNQVVLFDPSATSTPQLWTFDGTDWAAIPADPIRNASAPGLAYDTTRHRLILYGGAVFPFQLLDDTWQFSSPPCASNSVFPAPYATVEGDAALSFPFTLARCRTQFLLAASGFSGKRTGTVSSLDFRRDRGIAEQKAKLVDCEIYLAHAKHPPNLMSTEFDDNWWLLRTRIHNGVLALPRNPPAAGGVAPFSIRIPCAQPFTWTGLDLLIDFKVTSNTAPGIGTYELDAVSRPRVAGSVDWFGQSCRGQGGEPQLQVYLPELLHPGGLLVSQIYAASQGAYAISFLGTSTSDWAGLTLPFTWPQTNCSLFTGAEQLQTSLTDASGAALVIWQLPSDPVLNGAVRYHQWAVLEPSYSYPPFAMSRAARLTFARPVTDFDTVVGLEPEGLVGVKYPGVHLAPVVRLVVQ